MTIINILLQILFQSILFGNILFWFNKDDDSNILLMFFYSVLFGIPSAIIGWKCFLNKEKVDVY